MIINENLMEALQEIQEECFRHDFCSDCPLGDGEYCVVCNNSPDKWQFDDDGRFKAYDE